MTDRNNSNNDSPVKLLIDLVYGQQQQDSNNGKKRNNGIVINGINCINGIKSINNISSNGMLTERFDSLINGSLERDSGDNDEHDDDGDDDDDDDDGGGLQIERFDSLDRSDLESSFETSFDHDREKAIDTKPIDRQEILSLLSFTSSNDNDNSSMLDEHIFDLHYVDVMDFEDSDKQDLKETSIDQSKDH